MLDLYVWAWSVKLFHKSRLYDRLSKFSESNDLDTERETAKQTFATLQDVRDKKR